MIKKSIYLLKIFSIKFKLFIVGTTGFEHCDVSSFQPVCKYNSLTMGLSHQREGIPILFAYTFFFYITHIALRNGLEPLTF